jgi:ribosome-associated protein
MYDKSRDQARLLVTELADAKAEQVVALDVALLCGWTDVFVIATVRSTAHAEGLAKLVKDFCKKTGLAPRVADQKTPVPATELRSNDWTTIDLGTIVVHLMSEEKRAFFDLETLWAQAPRL